MRENYVVNVTKFLYCVVSKLMPKCQAFIVHYMTLHIRESTHLTWMFIKHPFIKRYDHIHLNQWYGSLNTPLSKVLMYMNDSIILEITNTLQVLLCFFSIERVHRAERKGWLVLNFFCTSLVDNKYKANI